MGFEACLIFLAAAVRLLSVGISASTTERQEVADQPPTVVRDDVACNVPVPGLGVGLGVGHRVGSASLIRGGCFGHLSTTQEFHFRSGNKKGLFLVKVGDLSGKKAAPVPVASWSASVCEEAPALASR